MIKGQKKLHKKFKGSHVKIRIAKVIYDALQTMIYYLRHGTTPTLLSHFNSEIDRMLKQAWDEQKAIGWDQILKGRLSGKWEKAQEIYYHHNVITRASKLYTKRTWTIKTIQSLYDFTLGI